MKSAINKERRLTLSVAALVILACCLAVTSFALAYAALTVEESRLATGRVSINLNDGKPVITGGELVQPGTVVEKEFFVQNNSTDGVYYRLYFEEVKGGLAELLEITILDGETVLYQGTAVELSSTKVKAVEKELAAGEKKVLTARFVYPESVGNAGQNLDLTFTLAADAVQSKNNPDRKFS